MRAVAVADVRAFLDEGPVYCFTTDIEWSPEWAISATFALADRCGVPLTPFLTHHSEYLGRRLAQAEHRRNAGIHPNFLPGSTHGSNVDAVITTASALLPDAVCFRAHCFYDETRMQRKMADRGFRYDSNALAFLQPMLVPVRTATAILRFPVFWEDDVHSDQGLPWTLEALREDLGTPGLKIVNVHPLRVALNVPGEAFYESRRGLYDSTTAPGDGVAHTGRGTATLLEELMRHATSGGRRAMRFDQLYERALERGFVTEARR